jgi:hypothetical protein
VFQIYSSVHKCIGAFIKRLASLPAVGLKPRLSLN